MVDMLRKYLIDGYEDWEEMLGRKSGLCVPPQSEFVHSRNAILLEPWARCSDADRHLPHSTLNGTNYTPGLQEPNDETPFRRLSAS
jgi:hypothetical protein